MNTDTFLSRVLADEGFYCMFAFDTANDRRIQKFYGTRSELANAAHMADQNGFDAYFALATFEAGTSRKVDNVKHIQAMFLDLDCGPSKDYATQQDALVSLRSFCSQTGLPKPAIINSGRGVHVYWPLKEPVSLQEWLPVAEGLKRSCAHYNLLADPAVTADGARVLRVPFTHNHKTDPPAPVKFFGREMPDPIDFDYFADKIGVSTIPVPTRVEGSSAVMDALIGNKESVFKTILKKTIAGNGCEQLKKVVTNQAEVSEPLWRAGLSIAKFCTDGEKAAHAISKDHPEYTREDTIKKIELIKGPYTCAKFDEFNAGVCVNCPNWGKIKSPITLGQQIKEAEPDEVVEEELGNSLTKQYVIPPYPRPYFRGANGGVYTRTTNAEGDMDETLIYHNDIYVMRRLRDPELGEAIVMRLHLPQDGVREFTVPLTSVTSKEEFRKAMAMEGVAVTRMDPLMTYVTSWVNELQTTSKADKAHRQFGWTDEKCTSFVLGDRIIHADSTEPNPPTSHTASLLPSFEPRGDIEEWKSMLNFYNKDGFQLHQFVIGASFGSALMELSSINCAGIHLYGKSGVGKTTAMEAGLSLWGNPKNLLTSQNDTHNTRMHRGEIYHSLPLYMDELTNARAWELSDIVYQLTSGKQRGRMSSGSNTERYRGEPWKLLAVTSANASMWEKISGAKAMPTAEAQRMLEVNVPKMELPPKEQTDALQHKVANNYGLAAEQYIQYVIRNLDEVKKLINQVQLRLDEQAGLEAANRFWSVAGTMPIVGILIAKQLGFVSYDTKQLFAWVVDTLKQNVRGVKDMDVSVEQTLNDYMHEHWGNVLWIKSTDDLRGKAVDNGGLDSLITPEILPRGKLIARYETDVKRAYLLPKPLKAWCVEQQIHYGMFIQDLKTKMGAQQKKVRLSKGTNMSLPPTSCYVVHCDIEGVDETGNTQEE